MVTINQIDLERNIIPQSCEAKAAPFDLSDIPQFLLWKSKEEPTIPTVESLRFSFMGIQFHELMFFLNLFQSQFEDEGVVNKKCIPLYCRFLTPENHELLEYVLDEVFSIMADLPLATEDAIYEGALQAFQVWLRLQNFFTDPSPNFGRKTKYFESREISAADLEEKWFKQDMFSQAKILIKNIKKADVFKCRKKATLKMYETGSRVRIAKGPKNKLLLSSRQDATYFDLEAAHIQTQMVDYKFSDSYFKEGKEYSDFPQSTRIQALFTAIIGGIQLSALNERKELEEFSNKPLYYVFNEKEGFTPFLNREILAEKLLSLIMKVQVIYTNPLLTDELGDLKEKKMWSPILAQLYPQVEEDLLKISEVIEGLTEPTTRYVFEAYLKRKKLANRSAMVRAAKTVPRHYQVALFKGFNTPRPAPVGTSSRG